MLAAWGHTVLAAASTSEAIGHLRNKRLQAVFVDLGLLGSDLPVWRAARALPGPAAPIILISMSADDGEVERFGREQASAVLAPPFQLRLSARLFEPSRGVV